MGQGGQDRRGEAGMKVAFLGLGTMGYLMAARLAAAGVEVTVFNRTASTAARWCQEYGGRHASTPAQAVAGASRVLACVSDDQAVRDLVQGDQGAFAGMPRGAIFIDHSTGSATLARQLAAQAQALGLGFLDAPVTGGKPGAAKGTLTTMVGGDAATLESVRDTLAHYASNIFHVGPSGAGQITKIANQICIGGILESLAEALGLAQHSGLDPARVLEVLQSGSARSWQMEQRGALMVAGRYDFGFSVRWLAKDLGIGLDQAQASALQLPATQVAAKALQTLIEAGFGAEDVAALARQYRPN